MKTLVLLVTLLPWASAASASAAQGACDKMAPRTDGWEQIAEPDNAPDLLALANAERSEDALWYKSASGVVRACVYEYCGSLGYDFVQVAGTWSGGLNVLTVCHERGGA